jgi:hypothetical protein
MKAVGIVFIDGVQIGRACKQNGRWYLMENVDFGWKRSFVLKDQMLEAVRKWWRGE